MVIKTSWYLLNKHDQQILCPANERGRRDHTHWSDRPVTSDPSPWHAPLKGESFRCLQLHLHPRYRHRSRQAPSSHMALSAAHSALIFLCLQYTSGGVRNSVCVCVCITIYNMVTLCIMELVILAIVIIWCDWWKLGPKIHKSVQFLSYWRFFCFVFIIGKTYWTQFSYWQKWRRDLTLNSNSQNCPISLWRCYANRMSPGGQLASQN